MASQLKSLYYVNAVVFSDEILNSVDKLFSNIFPRKYLTRKGKV